MSMHPSARLAEAAKPLTPGAGGPYARRVERVVDALRRRAAGAQRTAAPPPLQRAIAGVHDEWARSRRRSRDASTD